MEIIKKGDLKDTIKFECSQCGCIFKAERSEWFYTPSRGEGTYMSFCPYCGNKVWGKG